MTEAVWSLSLSLSLSPHFTFYVHVRNIFIRSLPFAFNGLSLLQCIYVCIYIYIYLFPFLNLNLEKKNQACEIRGDAPRKSMWNAVGKRRFTGTDCPERPCS